ncbi:SDR family oxidoreductase [Acuticoccus sp. M5D2P5]|uniref:SDR family oxidoreductase n=1 Tax=Acuticoccus kalidii TaxID=2910977 RepID=UPI001F286E4C|nr:SDR family oxidoreductase [Acuticoccus kalidii]MCF3934061.1 SDR family oxidoreductase [Acuticoccus kalidii]
MKTWFITGASAGLGRIMAETLLTRGDRVVGTARRTGALDDLAAAYPSTFTVVPLDVTDSAAVRRTVDTAFAAGRIDVLVNNAGYGLFGAAEEASDADIERQVATNLVGAMAVIRAALPHLRAQGGGRIMQVSSEGGQFAYPGFSSYHATKWGIEGYCESLAQEVVPFGIDVVVVQPGPTATSFGANLTMPKPMPAYDTTPVGDVRRAMTSGAFVLTGDAERTVDAMIEAGDAANPAFRLTLTSTAFTNISGALRDRLAALEAQETVARGADRDA